MESELLKVLKTQARQTQNVTVDSYFQGNAFKARFETTPPPIPLTKIDR